MNEKVSSYPVAHLPRRRDRSYEGISAFETRPTLRMPRKVSEPRTATALGRSQEGPFRDCLNSPSRVLLPVIVCQLDDVDLRAGTASAEQRPGLKNRET